MPALPPRTAARRPHPQARLARGSSGGSAVVRSVALGGATAPKVAAGAGVAAGSGRLGRGARRHATRCKEGSREDLREISARSARRRMGGVRQTS